jgi:hypothetical protein
LEFKKLRVSMALNFTLFVGLLAAEIAFNIISTQNPGKGNDLSRLLSSMTIYDVCFLCISELNQFDAEFKRTFFFELYSFFCID